jgi:uncharacterized protein (TIGR02118 family)
VVKLVFCVRRLPHLTPEAFHRYWHDTHGPLVRSHASQLRIRRYVQLHTLDSPVNAMLQQSRGAPDAFDGIAELWWESADDLVAATATDAGRVAAQALLDDERRFIDLRRSPLWIGEEHAIIGGP